MFVDNQFQYSTPTTASASAALSQLALPHLAANTPSMAASIPSNSYATPPPEESSPIAAGLKRGMAEMFSASKRNPQHVHAQHSVKQQQQQQQQPSKPAVELPEVLASLISKCPPHNYPATPRSSTPAVANPKPFSFAKTFGQFYPNTTSLGDISQGCPSANSAPVVTSTDNSIFNSLLALTANVPLASRPGFPPSNGKAAPQDAHRF